GTHGCSYLLAVDMEMEPVAGYEFASWQQGFGDVHLVPDMATLRRAAWTESTAVVLCDVRDNTSHQPVGVAPRTVLRRQIARLAALGFEAKAASELEFYLFDDDYRSASTSGYRDLQPSGWYSEDYHLLQGGRIEGYVGAARSMLNAADIPVENSKGETGRGQHELNVRYAEALDMADRHTLMKHGMKELADRQGISVTFMAKPFHDDAGSSSHLHLSLWDAEAGTNVFAGDSNDGRSDLFRWFLAGWMAYTDDFMVCYAPTINSYKRYVDASWAPTRVAWSGDNRTAGFRVVGHGPSLRIECRLPGADCNPYLAYAASLASGLAGIEQRLEPPARFNGDVYSAQQLPRVARTLAEAVETFATSDVARSAFGDDVVDHYAHFHRTEVEAFNTSVTDWERQRYFERI
ncbi:MAG TPA: glutamine synthetase family protein, partial [Ilumatobacter sp.]|nr:glutamine synthetase family protein [Ilumatobacter sp.]